MTPRWFSENISEDILASRRAHTRVNPDSEILHSVEKLEILFRCRNGKEKVNTSQTERSLLQEEFYSFKYFDFGITVENYLLRSKSESDLKETENDPNRFESYLLDSLWHNLQNTIKSEGNNSPPQTF